MGVQSGCQVYETPPLAEKVIFVPGQTWPEMGDVEVRIAEGDTATEMLGPQLSVSTDDKVAMGALKLYAVQEIVYIPQHENVRFAIVPPPVVL
jgi:hypothetical protein